MDDIRNIFDSSEDEAEAERINNGQKEEGEYVTADELEDITEEEVAPEMEQISDSEIEVEQDTGDEVLDLEDRALTIALDAHTEKVESILQQMVIEDEDEYRCYHSRLHIHHNIDSIVY